MKIFNLNADEWDRTEEREGWRFKDAWVGAHTDAELIGASMYEVEPGNKQGPFHTHHANEEWAIVLRGEPTLRTHEGEQQLRQGDVVAFPRGKEGAHQIRNDTDAPVRVLMLSTLIAPDIVEYLDTGKIGARSVAGERVEPGDGIPVRHRDRRPPGLSLPALQHMGWRVLAVLKRHLHPKAAEIDSRITNPGSLPVDQRDATVALPQHVAAPDVAMQEHRCGRGHAMRPDLLVGLLQQRCRRRPAPPAVGGSVVGRARPRPVRQVGLWRQDDGADPRDCRSGFPEAGGR